MKVAYLGSGPNSFTGLITGKTFPNDNLIPILPVTDVVYSVENGQVDFGVIPLENIKEGKISEGLDSILECNKVRIVGEIFCPIVHCFGALENHEEIKEAFSKDTALNQCRNYLRKNYPHIKKRNTASTDEAVDLLCRYSMLNAAAIGSEESMTGKLEILARDISPGNRTRFAILSRDLTEPTGDDKTFLTLYIEDKPGALCDELLKFKQRDINMKCLSERSHGEGYYFYVEIEGHEKDKKINEALNDIKSKRVLGSYRNSHWKEGVGYDN